MQYQDLIEQVRAAKAKVAGHMSEQQEEKLFRDKGMYTPRERIDKLLDPGTFFELDMLATHRYQEFGMDQREIPAEGVIAGFGEINGRKVAVYSQDFSALGGTYGEMHGRKICALMDSAAQVGAPIIGICHSGGLRLHETLGPMEMFGQLFQRNSLYSGVVPQISIVLGVVAGGQAYSPGLTDFILMTKGSSIYIAGPAFVEAQTGRQVSDQELGGAKMHARTSGVVDILGKSEDEIFQGARSLIDYLPLNNREKPPVRPFFDAPNRIDESLDTLIPDNANTPYDMKELILKVADEGDFYEIQADYAKNIITGFIRLEGQTVGVVANQPMVLAGCLDIDSSRKAARFVRFCDAFEIPILTLVDVPGFLPGTGQEYGGVIKHGAKLLFAYGEATVPKVTVITRKAYGGAYDVMASKHLRGDFNYAWPTAEIAVMGAKGAVEILYRSELGDADKIAARTKDYEDRFANPFVAAEKGFIDEVISPRSTRRRVSRAFASLRNKKLTNPWKKHDNIPL